LFEKEYSLKNILKRTEQVAGQVGWLLVRQFPKISRKTPTK
jgi:hypothetical protein